jgi:mRNA interferase MazF
MRRFEQGDVVRVPFPYTDRDTRQRRPALVVSHGAVGEVDSLLWVVMITSAANRPWAGDVSLADEYQDVGLPIPSVVRPAKIATIEARHADRIGRLPEGRWRSVAAELRRHLGFRDPAPDQDPRR